MIPTGVIDHLEQAQFSPAPPLLLILRVILFALTFPLYQGMDTSDHHDKLQADSLQRIRMLKITGARGSWIAVVQGHGRLPVIHNLRMNWKARTYRDPFKDRAIGMKKVDEWHAALEAGDLVVVQRGVKDAGGKETTARDGYVGVFRYSGYRRIDDNGGIQLIITERIDR